MQDRRQRKEHLLRFLRTIQRPDHPIDNLDDQQRLVESGLIDSLAVLQIVSYLEQTYAMEFGERGLDPDELGSVASILDLIDSETGR